MLKNGKWYLVIWTVAKNDGQSGYGVVIKGVDWEQVDHNTQKAVPLKACAGHGC